MKPARKRTRGAPLDPAARDWLVGVLALAEALRASLASAPPEATGGPLVRATERVLTVVLDPLCATLRESLRSER